MDQEEVEPIPPAAREVADPEPIEPPKEPADVPAPQPVIDRAVRRLDERHVPASRLSAMITSSVLILAAFVGGTIFWFTADDLALRWKLVAYAAASVFLATTTGLGLWWPRLELERTRWRVGPEGLEIKRGVIWRHVVTVPSSRIQHTDVAQGPIDRKYGLATLVVHTAGTHEYEINLEGIAHEVAFEVRDYLLAIRDERDDDGA